MAEALLVRKGRVSKTDFPLDYNNWSTQVLSGVTGSQGSNSYANYNADTTIDWQVSDNGSTSQMLRYVSLPSSGYKAIAFDVKFNQDPSQILNNIWSVGFGTNSTPANNTTIVLFGFGANTQGSRLKQMFFNQSAISGIFGVQTDTTNYYTILLLEDRMQVFDYNKNLILQWTGTTNVANITRLYFVDQGSDTGGYNYSGKVRNFKYKS